MLAGCSGPGHGTPRGRVGSYRWTCVSMMGKGNFLALAPVALALTAAAPAAASTMHTRRSIGFLPALLLIGSRQEDYDMAATASPWRVAFFAAPWCGQRQSHRLVSFGQKHYRRRDCRLRRMLLCI